MNWLGNTPEERKYNKIILLCGSCITIVLCGFLLRSPFLIVTGFILAFACAPLLVIAKVAYYSYLSKKTHHQSDSLTKKSDKNSC